MSEEFSMSVIFVVEDLTQAKDFKHILELLDRAELDDARMLLGKYQLANAQQLIGRLTYQHSDYSNQDDLLDMYIETLNDNYVDLNMGFDASGTLGEISLEGQDHGACDYCTALVLLLVAIGAEKIDAEAESMLWQATWNSNALSDVRFSYSACE